MEHWKSRLWFDFFIMELVSVLFWRVFATIFLISCFKGGTGFVLSRGLDTSKVYFGIPDSPGGMAPTTGYRDESDRDHNQRKEKEQSLNSIPQVQSDVQESHHGVIVDPMQVPSDDVRYYQQTLAHNNGATIYPNSFSEDLMKGNQLEIGQFNPYEVDGGKVIFPNSQNENLEEKERDKVVVPKQKEEEDLKEKQIFDEDFFLQVIPLAKPSTNSSVERS